MDSWTGGRQMTTVLGQGHNDLENDLENDLVVQRRHVILMSCLCLAGGQLDWWTSDDLSAGSGTQ